MPQIKLQVVTLNCWGLKYLSDHRNARLSHIGNVLGQRDPPPDIVGLQECWTQEDYEAIRKATQHELPYGKFYYSGVFGGGLAILSRWPIVESTMHPYSLNGRPTAFFRGDWFVGKGVACAVIKMSDGELVEVFCTHLHAPYEKEPNDSYLCHRTSQAWEISKLLLAARAKSRLAIAMGDFNMVPLSLAHRLITSHGASIDAWRVLKPFSSLGAAEDTPEKERGLAIPTANMNLIENGATCDSVLNTWRWTDKQKKDLKRGVHVHIDPDTKDPKAKRLDYVFVGGKMQDWLVTEGRVGMMERHPDLHVSLSDHFSVEITLQRNGKGPESMGKGTATAEDDIAHLPLETYDSIFNITDEYVSREQKQRRWRLHHFCLQLLISVGCLVAVWWSPRNYISFILMLLSTLGMAVGVLDGLIGGLFMSWELRILKEFQWEIKNASNSARTATDLKGA